MNTTADYGGDYSFLIHEIENRIDKQVVEIRDDEDDSIEYIDRHDGGVKVDHRQAQHKREEVREVPKKEERQMEGLLSSAGHTHKRQRASFESMMATPLSSIHHSGDHDDSDLLTMSTGRKLRAYAESDELRLQNEQLQDKIVALQDENARNIDKHARQLSFMEQEVIDLKKALTSSNEKYYEEKKKWQAKVRQLETEKKSEPTIAAAATTQPASDSRTQRLLENQIRENNDRIATLESSFLEKGKLVRDLTLKNAQLEDKIRDLEQAALLARSQTSSATAQNYDSKSEELREMRKKVADLELQLGKRQRDVSRLELKVQNSQLLQKEIDVLKSKIVLLEKKVGESVELDNNYQSLLQERQEWVTLVQSDPANSLSPESASPVSIVRALCSAQKKCAVLVANEVSLQSKINQLNVRLASAEENIELAKSAQATAEETANRSGTRQRLAQQQCSLFEREVKSLRLLLQSYDAELMLTKKGSAARVQSAVDEPAGSVEVLLRKKDEIIAELRSSIDASRTLNNDLLRKFDDSEAARLQLAQEKDTWQRSTQSTQDLNETVFAQLRDAGESIPPENIDYDPSITKVVHMVYNPSKQYEKTKKAAAVKPDSVLRPSTATSGDESSRQDKPGPKPAADTNVSGASMVIDGASVAASGNAGPSVAEIDNNKMNLRLKEMFKERITAFREAVYLLTGFKVDLISASTATGSLPRLRLRSMYAEDPDDSLLFQWRGDVLELLDTPFASKLDSRIFAYLTTCNSVPAFLASITMELFDNQTFQG